MPLGTAKHISSKTTLEGFESHHIITMASHRSTAIARARQLAATDLDVPIRLQDIKGVADVDAIESLSSEPPINRAIVRTSTGNEIETDIENIDKFYEELTDRIPGVKFVGIRRRGLIVPGFKLNPDDESLTVLLNEENKADAGYNGVRVVTIEDERRQRFIE